MRNAGTVVLAMLLSGLIAGTIQQQLAVAFNAHEEFIAAIMLLVLFMLVSAAAFLVALIVSRTAAGVNLTAIVLAAGLFVALMGLEALSLAGGSGGQNLRGDAETLAELLIPGLVVVVVQWWLVRWWMNATR